MTSNEQPATPLEIALTALHTRVTRVFPAQIRAAVEPLTDEQLWWRPNEESNSIGNLLLHLAGSVHHFLNRNLGGVDFTRDREAEFAERQQIPKAELLARFDAVFAAAEKTFSQLTVESLSQPSPVPTMHYLVIEDLINIAGHIATHTGQIVWIAKMFDGKALNEVWMRSHKKQGAWRQE